MPRGRAQRILPPSIRTHATVSISTAITPPRSPHLRRLPHPRPGGTLPSGAAGVHKRDAGARGRTGAPGGLWGPGETERPPGAPRGRPSRQGRLPWPTRSTR
ncbi:hypothetical protein SCMC78_22820 [Streptomyces sp. CMC78]|uniref:Uncharacterized protein n=1 Tax=Streptomyces sp. CMC78 TaxID=3231512 RepID=A0AB33KDR8_9ACTN